MEKFMKKYGKLVILAVLLIAVIVTLVLVLKPKENKKVSNKTNNGITAHTEEGIVKEEEYKGIKYSNISLLTEDGYTTFSADVTNISNIDITTERFHVSLKDKDGKEVIKLLIHIPGGLKKGETKTVTASTQGNLSNVVTKDIIE